MKTLSKEMLFALIEEHQLGHNNSSIKLFPKECKIIIEHIESVESQLDKLTKENQRLLLKLEDYGDLVFRNDELQSKLIDQNTPCKTI